MREEWTRELPEAPTTKPSKWVWFWGDSDTEPTVMELWPNRYLRHKQPGWWGSEVFIPESNPLKGEGIKIPPPQIEFKGDGLLTKKAKK